MKTKKLLMKLEAFASDWRDAKALLNGRIGRFWNIPTHRVTFKRVSGRAGERGTFVCRVWELATSKTEKKA